jgi:hypothetical protein
MNPLTIKLLTVLLFTLMLGCTKEQFYRGIYDGAATQERLKNPSGPLNEPMSYDQYERERKEKKEIEE